MKASLSLVILAVAAVSQATIIDDFTTGEYTNAITSGISLGYQTGSMLGGARGTYMQVLNNPLGVPSLNLMILNGMSITSSGTLLEGRVQLGYGYLIDNGQIGTQDLNHDFTGESAFKVDFLANDLPLTMNVYAGDYETTMAQATVNVAGGEVDPFTVLVPFSSFAGSVNWNDVDQVVFEFITSPSGDFALSNIQSVPEPASIAALALGGVALINRRRRNR